MQKLNLCISTTKTHQGATSIRRWYQQGHYLLFPLYYLNHSNQQGHSLFIVFALLNDSSSINLFLYMHIYDTFYHALLVEEKGVISESQ